MTKAKYWQKRAELAEAALKGFQSMDLVLPDGLQSERIDPWSKFIEEAQMSEVSYLDLELFERHPISGGLSMLRVPGGHVLEYWDALTNIMASDGNIVNTPARAVVTSSVYLKVEQ